MSGENGAMRKMAFKSFENLELIKKAELAAAPRDLFKLEMLQRRCLAQAELAALSESSPIARRTRSPSARR